MNAAAGLLAGTSALLLFAVEPLAARLLQAELGGGAAVWLTAIGVFQLLLLGGYALAARLMRLGPGPRTLVLAALFVASLAQLPPGSPAPLEGAPPALRVALALAAGIGLPFVALSVTTPVLIELALRGALRVRPWALVAISNAGSLGGLLAYPLLLERWLDTGLQRQAWTVAYGALLLAWIPVLRAARRAGEAAPAAPATRGELARWFALALVPAAALGVVTAHVNEDVVAAPLLWVVPLAVYLISFVVAFGAPRLCAPAPTAAAVVALGLVLLADRVLRLHVPLPWHLAAALGLLLAAGMHFHGRLSRARPTSGAPAYTLAMAAGGAAGTALVTIVAPLALRGAAEVPVVLAAAAAGSLGALGRRAAIAGAAVATVLLVPLAVMEETGWRPAVLREEGEGTITRKLRSFYGLHAVEELPAGDGAVAARLLRHGTTLHGGQARHPGTGALMPVLYYHERTGVGQALLRLEPRRVAVIGLGAGVLAAYGRPGLRLDFVELDPAVAALARGSFDYLRESRSEVHVELGDGRASLARAPAGAYDLVVVDAFAGDAVPAHLVTREALGVYRRALGPRGVVLVHVSSRFVDLWPVLAAGARAHGLDARFHLSEDEPALRKLDAAWIAVGPEAALERLTGGDPAWMVRDRRLIEWTDGRYDVWSVLDLEMAAAQGR